MGRKVHGMHQQRVFFDLLESRSKQEEYRRAGCKWDQVKIGDVIKFFRAYDKGCNNNPVLAVVEDITTTHVINEPYNVPTETLHALYGARVVIKTIFEAKTIGGAEHRFKKLVAVYNKKTHDIGGWVPASTQFLVFHLQFDSE
eukprot:CAMPEP_0181324448 /NCGR_PEP_ID=MMETSP1101-20121128/20366_1 /TAXON_ID=46948 /ORGANISM="Rhodomonas abbreviata, Strain Caron Lab Isolate" /LENGTH=142 /DNA_ID=CAMNT_0023432627 /DNA_START=12 /DNA_END=440 /DNA_ORIENTATION=+